jgi:regulatory protein
VPGYRRRKIRPPLDPGALERLVLAYVGRYATTRAKLRLYIRRKLQERGWDGAVEPQIETLVERVAALGYVDDGAFAAARAASLHRRGFGERRVAQALAAAGIEAEDAETAREQLRPEALAAALRFAERRRIGPFAPDRPDRAARERAFASMVRAGHPIELIKRILDAGPGELPEPTES